ncbi:MAG: F0F1 ATP synthase subunit B [Buchnera aphidicola (Nurudea yanoniella)]
MNFNATILGQAISFFLFVFFCMKYIWPPIMCAINNRQKKISNSLLNIQNKRKKLDSYRIQIKNEMKNVKKVTKEIIDQTNKKRNIILENAKIQAQKEKEKVLEQTQSEIKIAYKKLKYQLNQEVSEIAIKISKKIIENKINEKKMKNIVDDLIQKLTRT